MTMDVQVGSPYGSGYIEAFPEAIDKQRGLELTRKALALMRVHNLLDGKSASIPRALVLGAGPGTHDEVLVQEGYRVVNVDIEPFVAWLGKRNTGGIPVDWVIADAYRPLGFAPESFDMALCLSAFGLSWSDDDHINLLRNLSRLLRPGSPFVLETANGEFWLQRSDAQVERMGQEIRAILRVRVPQFRRGLDLVALAKHDGSLLILEHHTRYYTVDELIPLLNREGLRVVAVYGDLEGSGFHAESRSIVLVGYNACDRTGHHGLGIGVCRS